MELKEDEVVNGIKEWTMWWIEQRRNKLIRQLSNTMSLNPFITPFLFDYHNLNSIEDFVDLILASHLMNGHNTGFGKLVDEKFLPNVFGAKKLDKKYREANTPLENSAFNEIDHLITRTDGAIELLSLKAGKWTIQLSMAIQLNRSFSDILKFYGKSFDKIVVGVYYGNSDSLTDKYDILRGINRGAEHHVNDLTKNVRVYAGQEFWTWLGNGNENTQFLVLKGIVDAIEEANIKKENKKLLDSYKSVIGQKFESTLGKDSPEKWIEFLQKINS